MIHDIFKTYESISEANFCYLNPENPDLVGLSGIYIESIEKEHKDKFIIELNKAIEPVLDKYAYMAAKKLELALANIIGKGKRNNGKNC